MKTTTDCRHWLAKQTIINKLFMMLIMVLTPTLFVMWVIYIVYSTGIFKVLIQQPTLVNNLWNTGGVRTHLNRAPYEANCEGGHVVSRYLSSLNDTTPKIRNVVINGFNSVTGLLTVSSYEYRTTSAPWPTPPAIPNRVCPGINLVMSTDIEVCLVYTVKVVVEWRGSKPWPKINAIGRYPPGGFSPAELGHLSINFFP